MRVSSARLLRKERLIRQAVLEAFSGERIPLRQTISPTERRMADGFYILNGKPVSINPDHSANRDRDSRETFALLRNRSWDSLSEAEVFNDINGPSLSFATYRYFIQAKILSNITPGHLINMDYCDLDLGTFNLTWTEGFIVSCSFEEQNALWLYTKYLAAQESLQARVVIRDFWIPFRKKMGLHSRIGWSLSSVAELVTVRPEDVKSEILAEVVRLIQGPRINT